MKRDVVRTYNRVIGRARAALADEGLVTGAGQAALELLARSVKFGHERIAIRRLLFAVELGAGVSPQQWRYCREVAERSPGDVQALFVQAIVLWQGHTLPGTIPCAQTQAPLSAPGGTGTGAAGAVSRARTSNQLDAPAAAASMAAASMTLR